MSVVGNDVVDLDAQPLLRERYVARVCTPSEVLLLPEGEGGRRPDEGRSELFWALFAAKEAAYKAVVKLGRKPGLAYKKFEVAADWKSVRFEELTLSLELERLQRAVHAMAWLGERPRSQVVEATSARPSLLKVLGHGHAIERRPEAGAWDGLAPPFVTRDGARAPFDVSLSHDGRFAAWAVAPAP